MEPQKRAMAIHDISCVGRCSLTVALPILSAAGIDTGVLPTAVLSYKCSDYYHPDDDRGIAWNDPGLGIHWPIPGGTVPILSEKDGHYPNLKDVPEAELPIYPRQ